MLSFASDGLAAQPGGGPLRPRGDRPMPGRRMHSGFPGCTEELARVAEGIWWIWLSVKALSGPGSTAWWICVSHPGIKVSTGAMARTTQLVQEGFANERLADCRPLPYAAVSLALSRPGDHPSGVKAWKALGRPLASSNLAPSAPLTIAFASLDPATTRKDSAPARKDRQPVGRPGPSVRYGRPEAP